MVKQLALLLPGASDQPLAEPSNLPVAWRAGENTGAAVFQTGINLLFGLATFLAIVFLIFSGIQWMTSGGDAEKIATAKTRMKYALIGLVVVVASFFIVTTIAKIFGVSTINLFNPKAGLSPK